MKNHFKTPLLVSFLALAMLGAQLAHDAMATPIPSVAAQQYDVSLVVSDHKAEPWEHVLVDVGQAGPNPAVVVFLPTFAHDGDRVRVSEVSADGAVGAGGYIAVTGPSSSAVVGGTALLGGAYYVVANDGFGYSKQHANIELVWVGDGWIIVAESAKP